MATKSKRKENGGSCFAREYLQHTPQSSRDTHGNLSASAVPQRQQDKRGRELSTFQTRSIVNSALLRLTGDK
jgi:hypothetical protein